jgi:hypothetical protein
MRDIEGVEDVVRSLAPHWAAIEEHFHRENARYIELLRHDHDALGRVLKCHLIVEHYLDRFLAEFLRIDDLADAKLSFLQKCKLLPNQGSAAAFVKPGILRLNSVRNRFGHTLRPDLDNQDLGTINEILAVARPNHRGDNLSRIEAFTTVAVTFLVVPPPNLQQAFLEAFHTVRVNVV